MTAVKQDEKGPGVACDWLALSQGVLEVYIPEVCRQVHRSLERSILDLQMHIRVHIRVHVHIHIHVGNIRPRPQCLRHEPATHGLPPGSRIE